MTTYKKNVPNLYTRAVLCEWCFCSFYFWLLPNSKLASLTHKMCIVSSSGRLYSTALWCFEIINKSLIRLESDTRPWIRHPHCFHQTTETSDGAAFCRCSRPEGQSGVLVNMRTDFTNAEANHGRSIVSLHPLQRQKYSTQLCHPSISRHPPPPPLTLLSASHMSRAFKIHLQHKWPIYSQPLFSPCHSAECTGPLGEHLPFILEALKIPVFGPVNSALVERQKGELRGGGNKKDTIFERYNWKNRLWIKSAFRLHKTDSSVGTEGWRKKPPRYHMSHLESRPSS